MSQEYSHRSSDTLQQFFGFESHIDDGDKENQIFEEADLDTINEHSQNNLGSAIKQSRIRRNTSMNNVMENKQGLEIGEGKRSQS